MISSGSRKRWRFATGAAVALALVAGACSGDDDDSTAEEPAAEEPAAEEPAAEEPAADEPAADDPVEVTQDGGRLDAVRARGSVICGVNNSLPGFGVVDSAGEYSGFDIDFCKAVAAGVLGDAEAVEYVELTSEQRFTALQAGEIDVLIRNTTWTATRDGTEGSTFLFTTFFDGQGVMVPTSTGYTELEDLADASICVLSGTTTELNLNAVFVARGIPFNPVVFEDDNQLRPAYEEGQCEAWTTDSSALASWQFTIESEGGEEQTIMSEIISKEPLGPVVPDGDSQWAQAVEWSVMATVAAWEFGLDASNIGSYTGEDPNILNFLGVDGFDPGLGLDPEFAINIVSAVGNYKEIYDRHITPLGLTLEGSVNDLWSNGGLMYVPPYR